MRMAARLPSSSILKNTHKRRVVRRRVLFCVEWTRTSSNIQILTTNHLYSSFWIICKVLRVLWQVKKECGSNESYIRLNFQVNCCAFFCLLSTNEKYLHVHRFESNKSSYIDHNTYINRQNKTGKRLTTLDLRLRPSIKEGANCWSACFFASAPAFSAQKINMGVFQFRGKLWTAPS